MHGADVVALALSQGKGQREGRPMTAGTDLRGSFKANEGDRGVEWVSFSLSLAGYLCVLCPSSLMCFGPDAHCMLGGHIKTQ
jgi:hypothetical protein